MQRTADWLVTAFAMTFAVLMMSQGHTSLLVAAGVAVSAVMVAVASSTLVARYAAVAMRSYHSGGVQRGWVRRQQLRAVPEPQHPHTAGRRRSRAPSERPTAA